MNVSPREDALVPLKKACDSLAKDFTRAVQTVAAEIRPVDRVARH